MHAMRPGVVLGLGFLTAAATFGCSNTTGGGNPHSSGCSIAVKDATYSPTIGTVGIVTWSTTLARVDKAQIDFGLDTNYGLVAPVDLEQRDYRTPLLGMKENRGPYHFRVTAQTGQTTCVGEDHTFNKNTGARPSDLAVPTVTTYDKSALDGGFLITVGYWANSPDDYAFILDGDGDFVWWYKPVGFGDLSAALMSYDGNSIWIAHTDVPEVEARVGRIRMDGTGWTDLRAEFVHQDHDLAVLPDETVIYLAYSGNECDDIVERSPDGTKRTIINTGVVFGNPIVCHSNAIQYSPWDDTVVVSDDDFSAYFKVDRHGAIKWVLNGGEWGSFDKSGGGATGWVGNHNFHLLGPDRIVFFNNGVDGVIDGVPAVAREIQLDLAAMTTTEIWSYTAEPPMSSAILGDVERLPNGNTMVAYSENGTIQEVSPEGTLLQEISFGAKKAVGYITKRKSLYGSPPR